MLFSNCDDAMLQQDAAQCHLTHVSCFRLWAFDWSIKLNYPFIRWIARLPAVVQMMSDMNLPFHRVVNYFVPTIHVHNRSTQNQSCMYSHSVTENTFPLQISHILLFF